MLAEAIRPRNDFYDAKTICDERPDSKSQPIGDIASSFHSLLGAAQLMVDGAADYSDIPTAPSSLRSAVDDSWLYSLSSSTLVGSGTLDPDYAIPDDFVVVCERDLAEQLRKPSDAVATALNLLLGEQKVQKAPLNGYWKLNG